MIEMCKQFDYSKHPRMLYIVQEHAYLLAKLGAAVGFGSSCSISGLDEMLGCEFLPLIHVCLIENGALRFSHVTCEEEAL